MGEGVRMRDCRLLAAAPKADNGVDCSSVKDVPEMSARDLSPVRGEGVREGVGSPPRDVLVLGIMLTEDALLAVTRFEGLRARGRRLRLAGRGRV